METKYPLAPEYLRGETVFPSLRACGGLWPQLSPVDERNGRAHTVAPGKAGRQTSLTP